MIGVRLLLLAGPAVGTADITGMPDRAVVGGNRPPLGMLATPLLPTGNVPLGDVLAGAAWVARCWSTISLRLWVMSATAALTVSFTKACTCTSCNALWFSSVRGRCCPAVGMVAPSGFSAIVAGRVLTNELVLLAWGLPTLA